MRSFSVFQAADMDRLFWLSLLLAHLLVTGKIIFISLPSVNNSSRNICKRLGVIHIDSLLPVYCSWRGYMSCQHITVKQHNLEENRGRSCFQLYSYFQVFSRILLVQRECLSTASYE